MSDDKFEIYTRLMGGEQNLPPKLATPLQTTGDPDHASPDLKDEEITPNKIVDAFGNLQTYDDFVATHPFPAPKAPAYDNRHAAQPQQNNTGLRRGIRRSSEADADIDFTLDPRKGEPSEVGMSFCPFLALAKFPYKYVDSAFRQPIATAFFDEGKIYNRSWDFYYAWSETTGKAIAFIPLSQAQALIDEVNGTFSDLHWQFEFCHEEEGLLLTFNDPNPDHRPRFLGSADSRDKYDFILGSVEPSDFINMDSKDNSDLAAFKEMMALAAEANKNKSKARKKERLEKNIFNRQSMSKQLLQAQKYLGLIPGEAKENMQTNPINVSDAAAHLRESDVIIIAIDVEAYEKSPRIITEVGVSTLDTRDLQDTVPGKNGQNWQKFVRARHFRVIENRSFVNGDFVAGCPDNFNFGASEMVPLKNMPSVLTQCFHEPFSKTVNASSARTPVEEDPTQKRNIVLLGHDIKQDIDYCHQLGFSVLNRGNMINQLDTKAMYQAYTRDPNARGLGGIMNDFDFLAWHLHNAGNDAVYTMWALLATCVQDAAERGTEESKKKLDERAKDKLESAIEAARERAQEDTEGWDLSEDGSVPLPMRPSVSGHYTLGGAPIDL